MKILLTMLSLLCALEMFGFEHAYEDSFSYDLPIYDETSLLQNALSPQTYPVDEGVNYLDGYELQADFEQLCGEESKQTAELNPFFEDKNTEQETRAVLDDMLHATPVITDDLLGLDTQLRVEYPDFDDRILDYDIPTSEQHIERAVLCCDGEVLRASHKRIHDDVQSAEDDETESESKRIKTAQLDAFQEENTDIADVMNLYTCDLGEKPYTCNQCHKSFTQQCHLKMHMRIHTGEKPYKCNQCDYAAAQKGNLTSHMRIHTVEKYSYKCEVCHKQFKHKHVLILHIRTHTGEKPYKCNYPECEYAGAQPCALTRHMRTHTGEKPFRCNQCDYAGKAKINLDVHMRNHSGEKPFACDLCHYATAENSYLTKHMRTHSREKPFTCDQCNKSFAYKSTLTTHMRTHTEDKPSIENN